jgi:exodeoxyribonuclease-3
VATLSRLPISNVRMGFMDELMPVDARLLTVQIAGIQIVNSYVPNGNTVGSDKFEYKLRWLERFRQFLFEQFRPGEPLLWMGDINIAPTPLDVYDSRRFYGGVGHHPEEFRRLEAILEFGLTDVFRMWNDGPGHYTFWDFTLLRGVERNLGWRIDHIYASSALSPFCTRCEIDRGARSLPKPSDHTPVVAVFDL